MSLLSSQLSLPGDDSEKTAICESGRGFLPDRDLSVLCDPELSLQKCEINVYCLSTSSALYDSSLQQPELNRSMLGG